MMIIFPMVQEKNSITQEDVMPIYEYQCRECGNSFEAIVSINNTKEIRCSKCNSKNTKKLLSATVSMPSDNSSGGCAPRGGFS